MAAGSVGAMPNRPRRICKSLGWTGVARTRMRTSPRPGWGIGRVSKRRTSAGSPIACATRACMVVIGYTPVLNLQLCRNCLAARGAPRGSQYHLHLRETDIHEQLCSRDVAAVVRCEKHDGLRDLVGCAEPAERYHAVDHLPALLACFRGGQQVAKSGRVDRTRTYRIHANAARFEVRRPRPRERAHGGFCRAVHTVRRQPFGGDDRSVEDDGSTI